jgi:hypothetical protein
VFVKKTILFEGVGGASHKTIMGAPATSANWLDSHMAIGDSHQDVAKPGIFAWL